MDKSIPYISKISVIIFVQFVNFCFVVLAVQQGIRNPVFSVFAAIYAQLFFFAGTHKIRDWVIDFC